VRVWHDVEVEDLRRQPERGAGVRNVHDTTDVALDGCSAQDRVSLLTSAMLLPRLTERLLAVQRRVNSLNLQLVALSLHAGPRTNAEGGLAAAAAVAAAASAVAAAASATSSSLASAAPAAASAAAPPAAPPPTPLDGGGREGTPGNPPGNPPGYGVLRGSSFGRPRTPPDAQLGAQLGASRGSLPSTERLLALGDGLALGWHSEQCVGSVEPAGLDGEVWHGHGRGLRW